MPNPFIYVQVIGITSTIHVLCGESFPTEIRTTANGIIFGLTSSARMVNVKLFPTAVASLGFHSVVYFYAAVAALFTIWGMMTMRDTDKLSLSEIQSLYSNKKREEEQPLLEANGNQTKTKEG